MASVPDFNSSSSSSSSGGGDKWRSDCRSRRREGSTVCWVDIASHNVIMVFLSASFFLSLPSPPSPSPSPSSPCAVASAASIPSDWTSLLPNDVNSTDLNRTVNYLVRYGYLPPDFFSDPSLGMVINATKHLQRFFNLSITGDIDNQTLGIVNSPRCGFEDVYRPNGTMNSNSSSNSSNVMAYRFFPDEPKWKKRLLKWYLKNYTPDISPSSVVKSQVKAAIDTWQAVEVISFEEAVSVSLADVTLEFLSTTENDFGTPGDTLAYAYRPEIGELYWDEAERWLADTSRFEGMDLQSVTLHELGHILGLGHSAFKSAIMYPTIASNQHKRQLAQDDINGLKTLYKDEDGGEGGGGDLGCPCIGMPDGIYDYVGDNWNCRRACLCESGDSTVLICKVGLRIAPDGFCYPPGLFPEACDVSGALRSASDGDGLRSGRGSSRRSGAERPKGVSPQDAEKEKNWGNGAAAALGSGSDGIVGFVVRGLLLVLAGAFLLSLS